MSNKVYVLGSRVNQSIHKYVSKSIHYSPPMSKNFFQVLFGIYSNEKDFTEYYNELCNSLSNYILEYWKMGKIELTEHELDLEELYTFIQLQREEAGRTSNSDMIGHLDYIYTTLNRLFLSVIHDFKRTMYYLESEVFLKFGRLLYKEKPIIITLNYDDFIERAIEIASGSKSTDYWLL